MGTIFQIRRGEQAALPLLLEGELAFCTDTRALYIGLGEENLCLVRQAEEVEV